jgi:hypothetical protein
VAFINFSLSAFSNNSLENFSAPSSKPSPISPLYKAISFPKIDSVNPSIPD